MIDPVLRPAQAAQMLGISKTTLWRLREELPPLVRITARCVGYRRSDLERYVLGKTTHRGNFDAETSGSLSSPALPENPLGEAPGKPKLAIVSNPRKS